VEEKRKEKNNKIKPLGKKPTTTIIMAIITIIIKNNNKSSKLVSRVIFKS